MTRRILTMAFAAAAVAGLASAQTLINGAGATFPYPMYSKWFDEYHKKFPMVQFNYQSIGSGGGINQVTAGTVDFGATDGPMNDMQLADFKMKRGTGVMHLPTVMGAVVPVYNIPNVKDELNFSGEVLANIYLGKITKWNDPAIVKDNPKVMLPANDIVVVHRSESSGTSFIWTDFLAKASDEWKTKVGAATAVNWPTGLGARGNEGISGQLQQTPNTIGYVELIYALQNKMSFGKVKNKAGVFVKADLAGVTAAAAAAAAKMPDDFRVSITNADGKTAYPVSSFTWLLVPEKITDAAKKKAIVDFLNWMLADGQKMTDALSYAALPKAVVTKELAAIKKIQ